MTQGCENHGMSSRLDMSESGEAKTPPTPTTKGQEPCRTPPPLEQARQERAEFIAEGEAGLAEVKATADHWQEKGDEAQAAKWLTIWAEGREAFRDTLPHYDRRVWEAEQATR